jgi:CRP/FNR family transcriptional regulator, cyclic AMP receptor protein
MTANDQLLETIGTHGLLKDLDPHHMHRLAGLALEACFEPGHVVFREGDESTYFYLIVSGVVALRSGGEVVQNIGPGEALGWSSLIEGEHKHFQAVAVTRVLALAFDGAELRSVANAHPDFGYALLKRLLPVLVQRLEAVRHVPSTPASHACA